jgi:hypothetical protein
MEGLAEPFLRESIADSDDRADFAGVLSKNLHVRRITKPDGMPFGSDLVSKSGTDAAGILGACPSGSRSSTLLGKRFCSVRSSHPGHVPHQTPAHFPE